MHRGAGGRARRGEKSIFEENFYRINLIRERRKGDFCFILNSSFYCHFIADKHDTLWRGDERALWDACNNA
jgi:hypothetical protein